MSDLVNKYNHIIVWLDENIASPDYYQQLKKAFVTTTDPESKILTNIDELDISNLIRDNSTNQQSSSPEVPSTFTFSSEIQPCLEYLLDNAGKKRIFFITSGSLRKLIVPKILTYYQDIFKDKNGKLYEDSIYILSTNMIEDSQWAIDYLELDCIKMYDDADSVLARLTRDIAKYYLSQGEEYLENENDILSLKKALEYLTWSKELRHKAQLVVKTHTSTTLIKDIDQLIIDTEFKMNQINEDVYNEIFGGERIKSVINLSRSCYSSDLLLGQSYLSKKREYLYEHSNFESVDSEYYYKNIDSFYEISKKILYYFGVMVPSPSSTDVATFNDVFDKLVDDYNTSFTQNLESFMKNPLTISSDVLRKLIIQKNEQYKAEGLEHMKKKMLTESIDLNYIFTISKFCACTLHPISRSLMDYISIFMLKTETDSRSNNESSLSDITTVETATMNRQAEYFMGNRWILKDVLRFESIENEWYEKFDNALTWYFVFRIVNPILPTSHPIYPYSLNLAREIVGIPQSALNKTDSLINFLNNSIGFKESLDKINNYEIDRLLYIIAESEDEIYQIDNVGDISFTPEFCLSAAVLIAQNRSSELFDLYKTSTGTFGSGMISSVSSLMENSFHNAMKITEQQPEFINSFLHLARADFHSKIDDWNGVNADLRLLNNSNIVNSYHYKKLKIKYEQASSISASILNKHQRIEYLLIRSLLCTTIGLFQDAYTALLDANYIINILSQSELSTEKNVASSQIKACSKFQSLLETITKYLQIHLRVSIRKSNEEREYLSDFQRLNVYFNNLNTLIGTCSIKYDEKWINDAFDSYFKALDFVQKIKSFNESNEKEFLNKLIIFEDVLKTLQKCIKQSPFSLDENIFSEYIDNLMKYDLTDEQNQPINPFVKLYYQILMVNTHQRLESELSNLTVTANLPQEQNDDQTSIPPVTNTQNLEQDSHSLDKHYAVRPDEIRLESIPEELNPPIPNYYNILSLDGGGIRGIVEAIFLMEIERRTGRYIGELFNCFAGTSTGGILACGLAKQNPMEAKELLSLYIGPRRFEIFNKRFLSLVRSSIYPHDGIEKILDAQLPTESLSDCGNHDLIIPTEIHNQGPALFINHARSIENTGLYFYNAREPNNTFIRLQSSNIRLKDIVRCTSAGAPFFPSKKLNINGTSYTFYDGGYRFNRPDHIALKWAKTVRQIPNKNILLLSLGNSNAAPVPIPTIRGVFGFIWNAAAINDVVGYNDPGDHCRNQLDDDRYIRISPDIDVSVAMDATDPTTLQLLWQAAWNKIKEMDKNGNSFNRLCIQLLIRSNLPPDLVGAYPPPKSISYYPTRYMREPDEYNEIDQLFLPDCDFNERHRNISNLLNKFYKNHRWPKKDRLQYPRLNTYFDHRSLSLAAGIGHIPSILHYLDDMIHDMNRPLTLVEVNQRDFRRSNGKYKWEWNSFHYAAANGEIIAALVLLYSKPLNLINLLTERDESVLRKMIQLLDQTTRGLFGAKYSPAELAESTGYFLMKEQLYDQRSAVKRQLQRVLRRRQAQIGIVD